MNKASSYLGLSLPLFALLIFIFAPCAHALTVHIVPQRIQDRAVVNLTRPFFEIEKSRGQEVGVRAIWAGKSSTTAKVGLTNKREVITSCVQENPKLHIW